MSFAGLTLLVGAGFYAAGQGGAASTSSLLAAVFATPMAQPAIVSFANLPVPEIRVNRSVAEPGLEHPEVRVAAFHHSRDALAQEVALLSRAAAALHDGNPTQALVALNEHEQKFPRGWLAEDRTAARIRALCALGRSTEADAVAARLSPTSLHGQPVQGACGTRK